jgi:XTP/dITP diphosphohydrolase
VGELLFAAVALAREHGIDAESALRGRARRLREDFVEAEERARERGLDPSALTAVEWREVWPEVTAWPGT